MWWYILCKDRPCHETNSKTHFPIGAGLDFSLMDSNIPLDKMSSHLTLHGWIWTGDRGNNTYTFYISCATSSGMLLSRSHPWAHLVSKTLYFLGLRSPPVAFSNSRKDVVCQQLYRHVGDKAKALWSHTLPVTFTLSMKYDTRSPNGEGSCGKKGKRPWARTRRTQWKGKVYSKCTLMHTMKFHTRVHKYMQLPCQIKALKIEKENIIFCHWILWP